MQNKTILITGGAGFIGSHVNKMLAKAGYRTIILDNLTLGNRKTVLYGDFFEGNAGDQNILSKIFTNYQIDAVMHFAAFINVGESVNDPEKYYENNVIQTFNLLQAMIQHDVKKIVFSSSAAIFGQPLTEFINEDHPCHPINPYGQTKLMVEKMLQDFDQAYNLKSCSLRYFNAAGGDPDGEIKYYQKTATNLIPIILNILKKGEGTLTIFGTDYPTPDKTCIRDYIHIADLGTAHIKGLEQLLNGHPSSTYNLGNHRGYSIREVISAAEKVTGKKLKVVEGLRRPGDPPRLVADSTKAKRELAWQPIYPSLEIIIKHAWEALRNE